MEKHTHACIKCQTKYKSTDPDPYYCHSCREENKKLAKEIDKKVASRSRKKKQSMLEWYDSQPKGPGGFVITKL